MPEPITTALVVWGSKDLLKKLLGPTADYLGDETKNLVEKCNINLENIFSKFKDKVGNKIDEPGTVNPRVLKEIMTVGAFCENDLFAEYYSGLLASSRNAKEKDDRAIYFVEIVKGLSSYQIRFHYMVYFLIASMFHGKDFNLLDISELKKMEIFIPLNVFYAAMEVNTVGEMCEIIGHITKGLMKENLVDDITHGSIDFLEERVNFSRDIMLNPDEEFGFMVTPTFSGAELFLWINGLNSSDPELFLSNVYESFKDVKISTGAVPLTSID